MSDIKATTQEHLDIETIKDDFVVLKNGSVCSVLQTTAVNFDLLSEIEQDAMISAFSMLLNSFSFPIQIVIRSKRLDITKYLESLERNEEKVSDPLLKSQAIQYRQFVQEVIEKNDVLDKKFYVVIPTGGIVDLKKGTNPFEWFFVLFGFHSKRAPVNVDKALTKAKTELTPKVAHVISEFNRIGVKATVMTTQELVELYFDIYNPSTIHGQRIRTNIEDYKTAIVNPAIIEE
ncbi:hypothetical protein H6802_00925 [Candidatus Nomurabacteria bacterium]|uniref:Uncharacterized protein n=1 Tax=candidate division WWE3 bacterium TaxID=2053526 RepID=A0A955E0N7_UNCKA|nr:hypothetical protein [candidate division WWE3 bacterium]MCB9823507.1 hypothetical protein [Candidatus Nomurabacteria bacterium]MCB9827302.1 hypothetical protein [Candidatus Nomurabacteria bacterium]HXK52394.1 hypothetical protein [bacterium]